MTDAECHPANTTLPRNCDRYLAFLVDLKDCITESSVRWSHCI